MKKILIILSVVLIGCSKDEIPQQKPILIKDCYKIMTWADDPDGDYITIRIAPYQFQNIKVNNFRDYMGKTEICDLTTIK
jgi:hypothetical protein